MDGDNQDESLIGLSAIIFRFVTEPTISIRLCMQPNVLDTSLSLIFTPLVQTLNPVFTQPIDDVTQEHAPLEKSKAKSVTIVEISLTVSLSFVLGYLWLPEARIVLKNPRSDLYETDFIRIAERQLLRSVQTDIAVLI